MGGLALRGVTKTFGDTKVIHGVDFEIKDGSFTVFVGPSGCGKSTLLRMICGLESVSDGTISIDDQVVNDVPAARRGLAMVFQSYALYPHMSVYQNMAFGLENLNTPRVEIDNRVREAARMLKLDTYLNRKPTALSGGQRQRVAIGRAIVREPKVFLFDEPLSNLDAELRVGMRAELTGLHRRLKTTIIYVTHDQVEAMTMADTIVVLRAGRVEQVGHPLELYNNPGNVFVAGFIGSPRMNLLPATIASVDGGMVTVALPGFGTFATTTQAAGHAAGESITIGIRPEHLHAQDAAGPGTLSGKVSGIEQLGGLSYIRVEAPDITVQLSGQTRLAFGEAVNIHLPPANIHVFDANGIALPRS